MPHKTKTRKAPRLKVGQHVVTHAGHLDGVGPMDRMIVTAVHSDGTVDLEVTVGISFERINTEPLLTVR